MITVDLKQGSPEWLEWRKNGLGGSDAPVVEGVSPYRSKRDLFLEKTGKPRVEDDSKDFIFSMGHKTEGIIRKQFQELMNVEMLPVCLVHSQFDYIRVSLDGFDSKHGVLEAKLVGKEVLEKARNGEIPKHHFSQMQYQLFASGTDIGSYFCHDGKKDGVLIEVRQNKLYTDILIDLVHEFWRDIQEGKIPPLSDMDYLIPEDEKLLKQLRDAKEFAENAEIEFERMKEIVINTYGHPKIAGGGVKIFKSTRQGSLNLLKVPEIEQVVDQIKKTLKADYLEKFRSKSSESWTVRIETK